MKSILICLLSLISTFAFSQLSNSEFPEVPASKLSSVAAEGDYIYTIGTCDLLMFSSNHGTSWKQLETEFPFYELDIDPSSNGTRLYLRSWNDIQVFDIETETFEQVVHQDEIDSLRLRSVQTTDEYLYVVNNLGIYRRGHNSNANWEKVKHMEFDVANDYIYDSDITEGAFHLASRRGEYINLSLDDWTVNSKSTIGVWIYKIAMVNDSKGYMYNAGSSELLQSTDNGNTWLALDMTASHPTVFGDDIVLTIKNNVLHLSNDSGLTSSSVLAVMGTDQSSISGEFISSDGVLYMVGLASNIIRSADFGQTFENLNPMNKSDLLGIHLDHQGKGYAVGRKGTIIRRNNNKWKLFNLGFEAGDQLYQVIKYDDERTLFASQNSLNVFDGNSLIEEIEGNWQKLLKGIDPNNVYAIRTIDGSKQISVSNDRGATWADKQQISHTYLDITQSTTGKLYLPQAESMVWTSDDQGETWQQEDMGFANIKLVQFLDDDRGVVVEGNNFHQTLDGGQTFNRIYGGYSIRNVHYPNENQIFLTTAQNAKTNMFYSEDGGQSFSSAGNICLETNGSFHDGDNTIWLAHEGGHINKFEFPTVVNNQDLKETSSINIFPNPAQSGQEISFDLEKAAKSIRIMDLYGRLISQTTISEVRAGYALPQLPAGCYFIEINTEEKKYASRIIIQD